MTMSNQAPIARAWGKTKERKEREKKKKKDGWMDGWKGGRREEISSQNLRSGQVVDANAPPTARHAITKAADPPPPPTTCTVEIGRYNHSRSVLARTAPCRPRARAGSAERAWCWRRHRKTTRAAGSPPAPPTKKPECSHRPQTAKARKPEPTRPHPTAHMRRPHSNEGKRKEEGAGRGVGDEGDCMKGAGWGGNPGGRRERGRRWWMGWDGFQTTTLAANTQVQERFWGKLESPDCQSIWNSMKGGKTGTW
ncbi:hypothetical protein C8J57DRAFT_1469835 [Mycena rebaudengoi]|nr:hypothetical protein C8J57DRAFT_1469835 [Mycena rebaudengoi]